MRGERMEQPRTQETAGMRLARLWLWGAPLVMLVLAAVFAVLAVLNDKWGLLAAMIVLALVAVGLFVLQRLLLRRI